MKTITKLMMMAPLAIALSLAPTKASAISVGLELSLVVDESGSVSTAEFELQRNGYVAAFQNPSIQAAIVAAGGIAVQYIQFAASSTIGIGWTHITDAASANAFAAAILARGRAFNSGTGVAGAINFARVQFGTEVGLAGNGFESTRQIIDVSGDGAENQGGDANAASNAAIAAGIDRVNGIVINPAGEAGLLTFYQTQVQKGAGSFTLVADDFGDFAAAVARKIEAEVSNQDPNRVPDAGGTLVYSLLSVGVLAFFARRGNRQVA